MAFSGALTLTDLNDFITPSQACIKPVEQVKPTGQSLDLGAASTEILIDSNGSYYEVSSDNSPNKTTKGKKLEQAQISLNDCLACSGCITSAESVLITLQSHTEVLNFLETNPDSASSAHKIPVLSIAPQSLASLAASVSSTSHSTITLDQILRRVEAFCRTVLGFAHIYDTTFARHIALLEHTQEFWERKRGAGEGKMPMLASACPGWICYAEKAHPEMLPFLARTKSPQQVMGTLVKSWLGPKWGKTPDQIYHVTVMPCYDKKLEASRKDFYDDVYSTRDVDCVITTGELELMMRERSWDISVPVDIEGLPQISPSQASHDNKCIEFPRLLVHPGTSSGSYLHSLIESITSTSSTALDLAVRTVRTSDYEEYTLRRRDTSEVVFKGAKCYGFRNLQNVVRKVGKEAGVQTGRGAAGKMAGGLRGRLRKSGKDGREAEKDRGYDYVEVMACPGGCVNGGGQLKPGQNSQQDAEEYTRDWDESGVRISEMASDVGAAEGVLQNAKWGDKAWTKKVEKAYWHNLPTPPDSPKLQPLEIECAQRRLVPKEADNLAARVLVEICRPKEVPRDLTWRSILDEDAETDRRRYFRTQYRAVESEIIGLAVKW